MKNKPYLITGATGNVGSKVVEQLLAGGSPVRVFTRDAAKVAHWGDRIEVAVGDFRQPDLFAAAAKDIEAAFLVHLSPDTREFAAIIEALKKTAHPRIVFLSSILADQPQLEVGRLHQEKEDAIRHAGLAGIYIRPGAFMTNAFQWIRAIKSEGVVYNPMAGGRTAPIAAEDIAAVAVKALTDPSLSPETIELTGPELLSVPDQVNILAAALNKPLRCVDITIETAVQNFIKAGIPAQMAAAVADSLRTVREGRAVMVKDIIEKITGRPSTTFAAWACAHASQFA